MKKNPNKEPAKDAKSGDQGAGADKDVKKPLPAQPPAKQTASAQESSKEAPAIPKATRSKGIWLLLAAILLVLGVSAGGGYWLWQQDRAAQAGIAELKGMVASLSDELKRQASETADSAQALQRRADALAATEQALQQSQASLSKAVKALHDKFGKGGAAQLVAEAEFLLRIANHRIQLEHDARGAIAVLETVDNLLRDATDPRVVSVREALAKELTGLRAVPRPDVAGMALTLSSLSESVPKLPLLYLQKPELTGQAVGATEAKGDESLPKWRQIAHELWDSLRSLVVVRRSERPLEPLLSPKETYFIYQNLQLRLDAARYALLRRDAATYQASLATARQWLKGYFDTEAAPTVSMLDTIARLEGVEIDPTLPVVRLSLEALHAFKAAAVEGESGREAPHAGAAADTP